MLLHVMKTTFSVCSLLGISDGAEKLDERFGKGRMQWVKKLYA